VVGVPDRWGVGGGEGGRGKKKKKSLAADRWAPYNMNDWMGERGSAAELFPNLKL